MDEETDEKREAARQKALSFAEPTCAYCNTVLSRHQAISPGHCGRPECLARHFSEVSDARELERAEETEERRARARRRASEAISDAASIMGALPEQVLIAPVPYQNDPISPLPEERRSAFEAHLDEILNSAFDAPEEVFISGPPTNPAPEPALVGAACAACQGVCCRRGGGTNYAFLSAQTILHLHRANPELTREDMREMYLSLLPEKSVEEACVFQSDKGCSLPRELRASLCNSFHCHDIFALHDQTGGRSDRAIVLVGMDDDGPRKVIAFDGRLGGILMTEELEP